MLHVILICFISYVIGSYPTAYFAAKKFAKKNVYKTGDRNGGGTNVLYLTKSIKLFFLVGGIDILKAYLAAAISVFILKEFWLATLLSGIFSALGHNYSIFKGFKGGKGASTNIGALLFINPMLGLTFLITFFTIILINNKLLKFTQNEFLEAIIRILITTVIIYFLFQDYWIHSLAFQLVSVIKYTTEKQWYKHMKKSFLS